MNFTRVNELVQDHLFKTFPAAQIEILFRGERVFSESFGYLDPDTKLRTTQSSSRFDLASVSKLFTVAAFMRCVEEQRVAIDQPVHEILPEFSGARPIAPYPDPLHPGGFINVVDPNGLRVDASAVTFRHLLAHNAGLPAWLPLWKLTTRAEMRAAVLETKFAYPIGARVVYSDIGLILLGFALEKICNDSLRAIVRARVTEPLGLESVAYGKIENDNVAPTEFYARHARRMCGEVHDENAFALGGAAGHAGLFGIARDVAQFGEMFRRGRMFSLTDDREIQNEDLRSENMRKEEFLSRETIDEMTREQSRDGNVRRGLGFALWSPAPDAASNPLSEKTFGHLGFTGTSLWIDPARELVIACLANRVYYGRENADAMGAFRVALNRAIVEII
ncbi:MAG: beta-lactamase family protein [Chloroflexi bacterium]|nr:beta-lactamase family protein [Chloroflexota bacterium]MBI3741579.1 beta-lactamase family protein [Chloroflexota bacterium]